jgi:hypothetical protein
VPVCSASASAFWAGLNGPIDQPSPITSRVTPWRMSLCARPSRISGSAAQLSMLMKPGATASPRASISVLPRPDICGAIAAIRSPLMATSPV